MVIDLSVKLVTPLLLLCEVSGAHSGDGKLITISVSSFLCQAMQSSLNIYCMHVYAMLSLYCRALLLVVQDASTPCHYITHSKRQRQNLEILLPR